MAVEYRTTYGEYRLAHRDPGSEWEDASADDPASPDGDGWIMVDSAAVDGLLFWFWARETGEG